MLIIMCAGETRIVVAAVVGRRDEGGEGKRGGGKQT
jgi:hypothetical protein